MTEMNAVKTLWPVLRSLCCDSSLIGVSSADVSHWSVGRQLDHSTAALDLMAERINELLLPDFQSREPSVTRIGSWILANGHIPRGRAQAPEYVIPEPDPSSQSLSNKLDSVVDAWSGLAQRTDEIAAASGASPHHALGNFTASEWTRFAFIHTLHHLRIIYDIIEGAGEKVPVPLKSLVGDHPEPSRAR